MKNGLFIAGIVLVIVATSVSTFLPFYIFFYLIPACIFILGVVLIWLSYRTIVYKVLWTVIPIFIFSAYQFAWYQKNKVPPETFLIPDTFRGKIHIRFNEPCGQLPELRKNRRIYRVPNNGILLTKFMDKQGYIDQDYCLVDNSGIKTILPELNVRDYNEEWTTEKNPFEPSRDVLGVFHAGRVYSDGTYEFYVSTYRQLKDSFDFQYDRHFDLVEQEIIDSCRHANK